jgi:hypothetical protein
LYSIRSRLVYRFSSIAVVVNVFAITSFSPQSSSVPCAELQHSLKARFKLSRLDFLVVPPFLAANQHHHHINRPSITATKPKKHPTTTLLIKNILTRFLF